jgi:DNA-binding transcriptional LysR family regulator
MSRIDTNRSGELEVFVRVVERGGFSAAARDFRMTPSAVSKLITRLEGRLGARLLNRSTRRLQLTPEGTSFYERGVRILSDMETAEREAAAGAVPRGRVRVNANVAFGMLYVLPILPAFLARHPGITVDVALTDTVVDLLEERADIAIRVGQLRESRLLARKLGECGYQVVAAPEYLRRNGMPETPEDVARHNSIGFCFPRYVDGWPFRMPDGRTITVAPTGNVLVSNGEAMRHLVAAGLGLARLSRWHVKDDIAAGRLVPVLDAFNAGDIDPVSAVFIGQSGNLPGRVRALLDYLVETVRL